MSSSFPGAKTGLPPSTFAIAALYHEERRDGLPWPSLSPNLWTEVGTVVEDDGRVAVYFGHTSEEPLAIFETGFVPCRCGIRVRLELRDGWWEPVGRSDPVVLRYEGEPPEGFRPPGAPWPP